MTDTRAAAKRLAKKLGLLKATEDTIVHIERAIQQARAPLRWTKDKPTVPGWYWWRRPGHNPALAQVFGPNTGLVFWLPDKDDERSDSIGVSAAYADTEWAGPIEPPAARQGEE